VYGDREMAMSPLRFVDTTALHLGYYEQRATDGLPRLPKIVSTLVRGDPHLGRVDGSGRCREWSP
jgi:uncharacterized protein (DUF2252 family)